MLRIRYIYTYRYQHTNCQDIFIFIRNSIFMIAFLLLAYLPACCHAVEKGNNIVLYRNRQGLKQKSKKIRQQQKKYINAVDIKIFFGKSVEMDQYRC